MIRLLTTWTITLTLGVTPILGGAADPDPIKPATWCSATLLYISAYVSFVGSE